MSLVLVLLAIIVLMSTKIVSNGNVDYIGREQTQVINGIFIIFVFLRHFNQYVVLNGSLDTIYIAINIILGQLIVTMFMFYSGYGVMTSILKKDASYINRFPKKRILKTAILFDIAILFYVGMNIVLGIGMSVSQIALSFIGWSGVGNSTWYIFAILMMYLFTYIAFKITSNLNNTIMGLLVTTALIIGYILVMKKFKDSQYYNTVFCYAMGMWFAYFKTEIEMILEKKYVLGIVLIVLTFAVTCRFRDANLIINQMYYLVFSAMIVMISMKIEIKNNLLHWCGDNLLGIYILQRLPMILLQHIPWMIANYYIYFALCVVITICMTILYRKIIVNKIERLFQ